MHAQWLGVSICSLAALVPFLAGCGSEGGVGGPIKAVRGDRLTLYSSLPKQGPNTEQAVAIENGIRLALRQAHDTAGGYRIDYISLDDSTARAGRWEPDQTSSNARRAADDRSTIAYIGDFDPRASAISIPTLNQAGIPQVSPSNTAVGLTSRDPGAEPGEPVKYYPAGRRTFARVIPRDTVQASALVAAMEREGCASVGSLHENETSSAGLARSIVRFARRQNLPVSRDEAVDPEAPTDGPVVSALRGAGAPCVVYAGSSIRPAVRLLSDVHAALPDARLFASDGLADAAFADPRRGGISPRVARKVLVTRPTLPAEAYGSEGEPFFASYRSAYGERTPDPYAIYGYESARLLMDAIRRAGPRGNDRRAVLDAVRSTTDRRSVLGRYGIDRRGDTTLRVYGVFKVSKGALVFDHTVTAPRE